MVDAATRARVKDQAKDQAKDAGAVIYDGLIIGAGLSGLMAAVALARRGCTVALVDREPPPTAQTPDSQTPESAPTSAPTYDGRTTAIAAAGQAMLAALDLWSPLADAAEPILDIRVSDGTSRHFLHYDHRALGDRPMGYIVDNALLRATLDAAVEKAPAIRRIRRAELVSWQDEGGHVAAVLADGGTLSARLLIGADGRESRVRQIAEIPTLRRDYGQTSMVFSVDHDQPHRGVAHERFLPGGPLAFLPMRGQRSSVVWTERRAVAAALMALDDAAFADALMVRFGDCLGGMRVVGRRWAWPLSLVRAERQTGARLVLVGDAAHAIHPIAGQGFNLGLRDIAVLAEEIESARRLGLDIGGPEMRQRYQARRRADVSAITLATDGLNALFSNDCAPLRHLRSGGLGLVNRLPPLKRLLMRRAMGFLGERANDPGSAPEGRPT